MSDRRALHVTAFLEGSMALDDPGPMKKSKSMFGLLTARVWNSIRSSHRFLFG